MFWVIQIFKRMICSYAYNHFHICLFWKLAFPVDILKMETKWIRFLNSGLRVCLERVFQAKGVIKQWTVDYNCCCEEGTYNDTDIEIHVLVSLYGKKSMSCSTMIIIATKMRSLRLKWLKHSVRRTVPGSTCLIWGTKDLGCLVH